MKTKKYKVRFHLGRGEHYYHWRVQSPEGIVTFYSPEKYNFLMYNCKLKNNAKTAEKIFNGKSKSVCAWIECETLELLDIIENKPALSRCKYEQLRYNPKVSPHWLFRGSIVDNQIFHCCITNNNKIFSIE
jgi:hypothetical protein